MVVELTYYIALPSGGTCNYIVTAMPSQYIAHVLLSVNLSFIQFSQRVITEFIAFTLILITIITRVPSNVTHVNNLFCVSAYMCLIDIE
jgi:hypothetical protein